MERIASFTVDHTTLLPGLYLSRQDGDIVTFDLRFKKPNTGDLLTNSEMHSAEHLIATLLRNSAEKDAVIYFGPMGCQTGFYFLFDNRLLSCEGGHRSPERGLCGRRGFSGGDARQEPGGVRQLHQSGCRDRPAGLPVLRRPDPGLDCGEIGLLTASDKENRLTEASAVRRFFTGCFARVRRVHPRREQAVSAA